MSGSFTAFSVRAEGIKILHRLQRDGRIKKHIIELAHRAHPLHAERREPVAPLFYRLIGKGYAFALFQHLRHQAEVPDRRNARKLRNRVVSFIQKLLENVSCAGALLTQKQILAPYLLKRDRAAGKGMRLCADPQKGLRPVKQARKFSAVKKALDQRKIKLSFGKHAQQVFRIVDLDG